VGGLAGYYLHLHSSHLVWTLPQTCVPTSTFTLQVWEEAHTTLPPCLGVELICFYGWRRASPVGGGREEEEDLFTPMPGRKDGETGVSHLRTFLPLPLTGRGRKETVYPVSTFMGWKAVAGFSPGVPPPLGRNVVGHTNMDRLTFIHMSH